MSVSAQNKLSVNFPANISGSRRKADRQAALTLGLA